MRTRSAPRRFAVLCVLFVPLAATGGCGTNPLPADRHVSQEDAITSGKGAYALVELLNRKHVRGELIAVSVDATPTLWILTDRDTLEAVPMSWVSNVVLGVHENNYGAFAAWVALGSVSTLSHGFFLIFSLPTWLIAGSSAAAAESHRGVLECEVIVPPPSIDPATRSLAEDTPPRGRSHASEPCSTALPAYARFPQGLPPGVRAEHLLGRAPWPPPPPPTPPPTLTPAPALAPSPTTPTVPYDAPVPEPR